MRVNYSSFKRGPANGSTVFISYLKVFYMIVASMAHLIVPILHEPLHLMQFPLINVLTDNYPARYFFACFPTLVSFNFVITSLLSMFIWYPIITTKSVSISQFILIRALRTLPLIIFMICLLITLPDLQFRGPLMNIFFANMSGNCFQSGWGELLFISNFIDTDYMCLRVSWFTSADMQLYIFSFFLLFLLTRNTLIRHRKKIIALAICFTFTLTSVVIGPMYYERNMNWLRNADYFFIDPMSLVSMYFNTFNYCVPYVIGMVLGIEMAKGTQWPEAKAKKYLKICILTVILALVSPYFVELIGIQVLLFSAILTMQRLIFAVGLGGGLFAIWSLQDVKCSEITSCGYICNLLSRMQYPYFLIHPLIISYLAISLNIPFVSYTQMFMVLLPSQTIISLILSTLIHVGVELPFARLIDLAVRKNIKENGKVK